MFLFNKRTKKIIRYIWGVFAVLIIISMVFAYSGFTAITPAAVAPTTPEPSVQVTPVTIATSSVQEAASSTEANAAATQPLELKI